MLLSAIVGSRLYSSAWSVIRVSVDFDGRLSFCLIEATVLVC